VDWSDHRPGWKFNEWEMRGAPVRIEIGPKDVAQGQALTARRDTRVKESVPLSGLAQRIPELLDDIQRSLFEKAVAFRDARTHHVKSIDEIAEQIEKERGFFWAAWCGSATCEDAVKERTGATLRCIPLEGGDQPGTCLVCSGPAAQTAVFARSY
jgi:prolyl-tRNA synthetase